MNNNKNDNNKAFFCFLENKCKCDDKNTFKFHEFGKHIDNPGNTKNIFIYGPHGTGKSYLINQLKNIDVEYFQKNKNIKFLVFDEDYVEKFEVTDDILSEINKELKNSKNNWDIDYFKKTEDLETFNNDGQKKMIALFWFFFSSRDQIWNDKTETKYMFILSNLSDYLDYFFNFVIDYFVFEFVRKFGLKTRIHSLLLLSHKISFLNFFINEVGSRDDTRFFRIFNDTERFLIELEIDDLIKTDFLLFSKVINNTLLLNEKTSDLEKNIDKVIFWSLSRRIIESIFTSIINIKNISSINAHKRGSFSQFYKYIDWLYSGDKDVNKKIKLILFLKKWKFVQKTTIENNNVEWLFQNKDIVNIFQVLIDLFYRLKFIDKIQVKEWNENLKKIDINTKFAIKDVEYDKWLEDNYESLKNNSDKGNFQNDEYEKYFLVKYSYLILRLLKKEYPRGEKHFSRRRSSSSGKEEHKAFILIRHAGNNLFPYIFNYNKEFFDNLLYLIK